MTKPIKLGKFLIHENGTPTDILASRMINVSTNLLSKILGRSHSFISEEISLNDERISDVVRNSKILIIGAAGSIGGAFTRVLAHNYKPGALHLVDISENNLVEVVRDLRSGDRISTDDFRTFAIDFTDPEFHHLLKNFSYDFVLNFSALKHVRSERDPFTLMRLLNVNVLGNEGLVKNLIESKNRPHVFSVSSDKAVRPGNIMGASKAFMERLFISRADELPFSSARFANVAFSDGSLLCSFANRIRKRQPLSAPSDVRRYFISHEEAGQLCLLGCFLGNNREIFFPQFVPEKDMMTFAEIARIFLESNGFVPVECDSEQEALRLASDLNADSKRWPCYFSASDTSGEKQYEEFVDPQEKIDIERFPNVGVVTQSAFHGRESLDESLQLIRKYRDRGHWTKQDLIDAIAIAVPEMQHIDSKRNLDQKM